MLTLGHRLLPNPASNLRAEPVGCSRFAIYRWVLKRDNLIWASAQQQLCTLTLACSMACTADVFLSVSQNILLHADAACNDASYGPLFATLQAEAAGELDKRCMLCLLLILEKVKGPGSKWGPYIDFLPAAYGMLHIPQQAKFCQLWLASSYLRLKRQL